MRVVRLLGLLLAVPAAAGADAWRVPEGSSVSVFGGVLTENTWDVVVFQPWRIGFENSGLAGLGASVPVWRLLDGLTVELEAQLVRHFGDQQHWEFNLPLVTASWSRFPWSERLPSYAAFGIGPSYVTEDPALEAINNRSTEQVLVYRKIELGADLPAEGWGAFLRLHHRSTGYGLTGEAGGSNSLALGLRRSF